MKEIGLISYPGRSHGQGILVYFKISDSTLVAKKVNHENSDEVTKPIFISTPFWSIFRIISDSDKSEKLRVPLHNFLKAFWERL